MSNNPDEHAVLVKQYLRSVLDVSEIPQAFSNTFFTRRATNGVQMPQIRFSYICDQLHQQGKNMWYVLYISTHSFIVKKKNHGPFAWTALCRLFDAKRSTVKPNKYARVDRSDK